MGTNSFSLSARIHGSTFLCYSLAIASVLIALLISSPLHRLAGDAAVFVLLLPAIAFSAWYGGIGPSILAITLALAGALYGPLTTLHSFAFPTVAQSVLLLIFVGCSVIVGAMAESRRRQNEKLLQAQGELESRVQERTADLDAANQNLRDTCRLALLQLQDDETLYRARTARQRRPVAGGFEHEPV